MQCEKISRTAKASSDVERETHGKSDRRQEIGGKQEQRKTEIRGSRASSRERESERKRTWHGTLRDGTEQRGKGVG
jgi:hypothetical protein